MEKRPESPSQPEWRPSRTILGMAILVQLLLVGLAIWYSETMAPVSTIRRPLVSEVLTSEDLVFPDTDLAPVKGKQLPPIDVWKAAVGDAIREKFGGQLFLANCATCHGQRGQGDGPAGATLSPHPRDLTSIAGWQERTRVSDLFRTVTRGLPGTQMPAFDYLSHEERFALVHFVRSLTSGHASDTRETLTSLDQDFSLSEGERQPNQIPVATAMERILSEVPPPLSEDPQVQGPGAAIFNRVSDPMGAGRIRASLEADSSWRNDLERLKRLVSTNTQSNGFRPSVGLLSEEDWRQLQSYLHERYVVSSAAAEPQEKNQVQD